MVTAAPACRRRIAAVLAAVVASAPARPAAAAMPAPQEYAVKAAFLYHFAHLVDWPAPAEPGDPFVIGVVGDDPFGPTLDVLAGKAVRAQPVRIRRLASAAQLDEARLSILFVPAGDDEQVRRALAAVAAQPVLTVGESPRFAERGGMIGFRVTEDGRVAFDINLQRAQQSGLRMRSQLLKLARIVETPR